jgi:hypothetical protein
MWQLAGEDPPRAKGWLLAVIALGGVGLYLGAKLALIKLLPGRFGHLRFP